MPEQGGQDKTEQATPKRREDEKEKGNVAKSQDLSSVAVLLSGIMGLQMFSIKLYDALTSYLIETYHNLSSFSITIDSIQSQTIDTFKYIIPSVMPIMAIIVAAGVLVNFAQVGVVFAKKAMIPDFKKISPARGLKNLFSMRSLVELFKGIIKMAIVGIIGWGILVKRLDEFWILSSLSIGSTFGFILQIMYEIAIKTGLVLVVLAAADYAYQKYDHEQKLMMTKQEVKDEAKQYENPETKGRIRSAQKQMARRRMMSAIPDATVVVTNPTHIAIAIKYNPQEKSDAPIVVAKGIRKIAQKIKEIARENDIPVIENKPLARQLYDTTEVGTEIPFFFYQAVAEILAQVYVINKNKQPSMVG